MITVKQLKDLLEMVPDDALLVINDNYHCSIVPEISYSTLDQMARVKLSPGFSITKDSVLDEIFKLTRT